MRSIAAVYIKPKMGLVDAHLSLKTNSGPIELDFLENPFHCNASRWHCSVLSVLRISQIISLERYQQVYSLAVSTIRVQAVLLPLYDEDRTRLLVQFSSHKKYPVVLSSFHRTKPMHSKTVWSAH